MLACDRNITLVQRIYNPETDASSYVKTIIHNASWFSKVKIELEDKGLRSADLVKVRIPEKELPEGVVIANGDYIINGLIDGTVNGQGDLEGYEYVKVVSVGDNRRGGLRHWAVIGKK